MPRLSKLENFLEKVLLLLRSSSTKLRATIEYEHFSGFFSHFFSRCAHAIITTELSLLQCDDVNLERRGTMIATCYPSDEKLFIVEIVRTVEALPDVFTVPVRHPTITVALTPSVFL